MRIKSGDTVVVISGKDKGKKGRVLEVYNAKDRVLVEGVNMATKHQKPNQKNPQGGIIHMEQSIHVSNVMIFDAKAGKGVRVGMKKLENGEKVRISKKSGEQI
ncbi:large subunit ribosomal protein L24 [Acetoanaerobium pronyense]|uniref:Large ribosomal subunit protein uL24 n=1 Tax=Acetoanaerobium pronyense TaxID=1482736 RepID=A0ABS4KJR3_9FIRM|nr:large subunit ribosomal protein L24 [Acetoanaerobium pronyense]